MREINVDLGARSYPIFIGPGLLGNQSCFVPWIKGKQVMVVTNTTLAKLYGEVLDQMFAELSKVDRVVLPDGEAYKNLDTLN